MKIIILGAGLMKIIILGAGQVGGTLAENLVGENNDITVVDTNGERLRTLQDKFDLRVVQGHGSHPRVLREAGADDADMLVAVTSSALIHAYCGRQVPTTPICWLL